MRVITEKYLDLVKEKYAEPKEEEILGFYVNELCFYIVLPGSLLLMPPSCFVHKNMQAQII